MLFLLAAHALADDVCLGAECIAEPVRDALSAAGVTDVDGLAVTSDGINDYLTVTSSDPTALSRAFPKAKPVQIDRLDAWATTVPIDTGDLDITIPYVGKWSDITLKRGGGGGGGGDNCYESCVCTETGVECWWECY